VLLTGAVSVWLFSGTLAASKLSLNYAHLIVSRSLQKKLLHVQHRLNI
jgi:hypothetical protein